ncbi:LuxR family transcriptional regulator [Mesorhizobium sp. M0118]|uniref:helix-turn-helix transcriptional regulator n=1 Tax=Mesorhizobium sp. M0118 TaxID=2956884 RepID=UPI003335DB9F
MERLPTTAVTQLRGRATKGSDQSSLVQSGHFLPSDKDAVAIEFGRFIEQAYGAAQPKQLFDLLSAFALNFDCPWMAYGLVPSDEVFSKANRQYPAAMTNYPRGWQDRYIETDYQKIDPIIKMSRASVDAFRWIEVYHDPKTTLNERKVIDEAAMFGVRSGISVPLHSRDGVVSIMSFAQFFDRHVHNRTITYLQMAALHFHKQVTKLSSPIPGEDAPNLSLREKECILWTARGKSSWEISMILGISINTVNFHMKSLRQKFGTSSKIVAVIKAASFGIIKL